MRERADVVVVGTGVSGLSLALELGRTGLSIVVVGPAIEPGRRIRGLGLGLVNAQTRRRPGPEPLQDLALLSRQLHPDWLEAIEAESGLSAESDGRGGLAVALTDREEVELDRALDWQRARALPFDVVPGEEAVVREPSLSEEIRSAFAFPLDGVLRPGRLLRSLCLAARSAGVRFRESGQLVALSLEAGRVTGVETADGRISAEAVVDTGTGALTMPAGGAAARGSRATYAVAELDATADPDRLSRFLLVDGVWIVPRRDGTVILAAEPSPGEERVAPRAGAIGALVETAARAVPAVRDYLLLSSGESACRVSPDGNPALGETAVAGLWTAALLGADEILLAPAVSRFLAEALNGRTPPLPPGPFLPARFGP